MVGFTYRRVPAATFARDLVAAGRIGEIRQVRAEYLQDWLMDAEAPLTWRLQKERAGSGALGDIGAHAIDLSEYITGLRLTSVSGIIETIVTERPLLGEGVGLSGTASTERGAGHRRRRRAVHRPAPTSGALGIFEATRFAHRPQERAAHRGLGLARARSRSTSSDLNELEFYDATLPADRAGLPQDPRDRARAPVPRAVVAGRPHARLRARLLAPGRRLRRRRSPTGTQPRPSFADGLHVQRVLDAVERSSAAGSAWIADRRLSRAHPPRTPEGTFAMARPITLFTGQWADLPLEEVARLASEWGYDGLEIACWGDHLDPWRWDDDEYVAGQARPARASTASRSGRSRTTSRARPSATTRSTSATATSSPTQVWGDGDPEGVRQRAAEEMKNTARLAAKLGVKTVVGFTGSSIWKYVAMFPPVSQEVVDAGYQDFADRWNPILDVFDEVGVRFAHEVHPSEIAYDYWTTVRTLEAIGHRQAFGLNWDPSPLHLAGPRTRWTSSSSSRT